MDEGFRVATEDEMAEDAIATANDRTAYTKIEVEVDGQRYTLEFNRTVVKRMERNGFFIDAMRTMPTTTIEQLVVGAFEMHHPSMSTAARLAVFEQLGGRDDDDETGDDGLLSALVRIYMVPVNSLMADPTAPTGTWRLA